MRVFTVVGQSTAPSKNIFYDITSANILVNSQHELAVSSTGAFK